MGERCGQAGAVARSPDVLSEDIPDIPAISGMPDWQWCLPSRRQQAGVSSTADRQRQRSDRRTADQQHHENG